MSLKVTKNIQYAANHPNLECFYLVIQVRSSGMNNIFELARSFVTWDSKQTSLEKPLWLHEGAEEKEEKNIPLFLDLSHPHWFVSYTGYIVVYKNTY